MEMFVISLQCPVEIRIFFVKSYLTSSLTLKAEAYIKQMEKCVTHLSVFQTKSPVLHLGNADWSIVPNKTRKRKLVHMWVDLNSFWYQTKPGSIIEFWLIYWHPVTTNYKGHIMVCGRALPMCVHVYVFTVAFLSTFGSHMAVKVHSTPHTPVPVVLVSSSKSCRMKLVFNSR